ncbi:MAG: NUMOD4 motif-containing HNH endonuclease [Oscillospiraceae bacterium]
MQQTIFNPIEHYNYTRRHDIVINSLQTRELSLLLSFVWIESIDNEVWKEIEGLDSRYFISTEGRVLSLCMDGYKLMHPFICGDGYYYVDLRKDGKDLKSCVHRLVAEAFIDNPEDKPIVHHRDTNRRNNKASNLQWMTEAEHAAAHLKLNQERKKQMELTAGNENLLSTL